MKTSKESVLKGETSPLDAFKAATLKVCEELENKVFTYPPYLKKDKPEVPAPTRQKAKRAPTLNVTKEALVAAIRQMDVERVKKLLEADSKLCQGKNMFDVWYQTVVSVSKSKSDQMLESAWEVLDALEGNPHVTCGFWRTIEKIRYNSFVDLIAPTDPKHLCALSIIFGEDDFHPVTMACFARLFKKWGSSGQPGPALTPRLIVDYINANIKDSSTFVAAHFIKACEKEGLDLKWSKNQLDFLDLKTVSEFGADDYPYTSGLTDAKLIEHFLSAIDHPISAQKATAALHFAFMLDSVPLLKKVAEIAKDGLPLYMHGDSEFVGYDDNWSFKNIPTLFMGLYGERKCVKGVSPSVKGRNCFYTMLEMPQMVQYAKEHYSANFMVQCSIEELVEFHGAFDFMAGPDKEGNTLLHGYKFVGQKGRYGGEFDASTRKKVFASVLSQYLDTKNKEGLTPMDTWDLGGPERELFEKEYTQWEAKQIRAVVSPSKGGVSPRSSKKAKRL